MTITIQQFADINNRRDLLLADDYDSRNIKYILAGKQQTMSFGKKGCKVAKAFIFVAL